VSACTWLHRKGVARMYSDQVTGLYFAGLYLAALVGFLVHEAGAAVLADWYDAGFVAGFVHDAGAAGSADLYVAAFTALTGFAAAACLMPMT
jgi:hypothetical protein